MKFTPYAHCHTLSQALHSTSLAFNTQFLLKQQKSRSVLILLLQVLVVLFVVTIEKLLLGILHKCLYNAMIV